MAEKGSFTTTESNSRSLTFSWNIQSQSVANNTTTIAYTLKGSGYTIPGNSMIWMGSITLKINNEDAWTYTGERFSCTVGQVVHTGTFTIAHNTDGTKSFSASCTAAIYEYAVNDSGSGSWSLPAIPRASTPTLADPTTMLTSVTINTNRASSSFTHDLSVTFGGTTTSIATGVGASYSWSVPDWSSRIANATSGTATLTCVTKNGNTTIGTKQVNFTLNVPAASTVAVSPATADIGDTVSLAITRNSSGFTDTIQYRVNSGAWNTIVSQTSSLSASWTVPASVVALAADSASCTVQFRCVTYNGTASQASSSYASLSVNMPSMTTPVYSAETAVLESALAISLPQNAAVYTHTISYTLNGNTTVLTTNAQNTYSWTPPASLADSITGASSTTITMTVVTKNGTATIGTNTKTLTLAIPDTAEYLPTISATTAPVEPSQPSLAGYYVMGNSKVQVTMSGAAKHSATVAGYRVVFDGATYTTTATTQKTGVISSYGDLPVVVTVTDSRGKTASVTLTVTVVEYSEPRLIALSPETRVIIARGTQNGTVNAKGEYLVIKAFHKYSPMVIGGTPANTSTVQYQYRQQGGAWVGPTTLTPVDNEINVALAGIVSNPKMRYTVQTIVTDGFSDPVITTYAIPAVETPLHLGQGGRKLGLGGFSTRGDYTISIEWDTYFDGNLKPITVWSDTNNPVSTGLLTNADVTMMGHMLYIARFSSGKQLLLAENESGILYPVNYTGSPTVTVSGDTLVITTNNLEIEYDEGQGTVTVNTNTTGDTITYLYSLM